MAAETASFYTDVLFFFRAFMYEWSVYCMFKVKVQAAERVLKSILQQFSSTASARSNCERESGEAQATAQDIEENL